MITEREAAKIAGLLPRYSYVRQFVRWAYQRSDHPVAYSLGVAHVHLATVAPKAFCGLLSTLIYPNLYVLLVGPSGARKTTAMLVGEQIIRDVVPERITGAPVSWEGMMLQLRDHPELTFHLPEFGAFLSRSRGDAGTNYYARIKSTFTDLYDCTNQDRQYASAEKRFAVSNPRVSCLAAGATDMIEEGTTQYDWTNGYMGRWLILIAQRERRHSALRIAPPDPIALRNRLRAIYVAGNQHTSYPCQGFSAEAARRWNTWTADLEARHADLASVEAALCVRTPVLALKLALHHELDWSIAPDGTTRPNSALSGKPWWVSDGALRAGIALAELHIRCAVALANQVASNAYEQRRRNVLRAIGTVPRTRRQIHARLRPKLDDETLRRVLASMEEAGDITRLDRGLTTYWTVGPSPDADEDNVIRIA